nr:unnamed protein product [Callosobruchus analis]
MVAFFSLWQLQPSPGTKIRTGKQLILCRFDENIKTNELFTEKIMGKFTSEVFVVNGTMKFVVIVRRSFKDVIGFPKSKGVKVLNIPNEGDGEGVKCRQPVRM